MKFGTFLFVFLLSFSIFAQDRAFRDDTIRVQYAENESQLKFRDLPYYDLGGFQNYRPFGSYHVPLSRSGNIGLPIHYYLLDQQDWNINHQLGGYQPWLMEKDSMRFYSTSRPFTELNYYNGVEKEQLFQVLHTQNLGEGLNISFKYQRVTSEGYYSRQLTNHTQFNATYNLRTRNQRFHSKGYFLINDMESQENGGIAISEDNDVEGNTILLDVGLQDAQNRGRTHGLGFYNDFDLWQQDSLHPILNLSHEIEWSKAYRNYSDDLTNTPDYYNDFLLDSNQTADSGFSQVVANTLLLNFLNNSVSIGARNEQYHYFQNYLIDENFESNYLIAELNDSLFNQAVELYFEKGVSGYHNNELELRGLISLQQWKGIKTQLKSSMTRKQPDYFVQKQRANHNFYDKSFKTSNQSNISIKSSIKKWNLSVEAGFQEYNNFIYYDTIQMPQQMDGSFSNLFVKLDFTIKFLKHMNLKNIITLQNISEQEVAPLPGIFSYHSLYYENSLIRNALGIQVGVDLNYIGQYEGYEYSPSLTQFYLSDNNNKLGNIAQIDLFLNLRINKAARLFVKMENVLGKGFSEDTYRIHGYSIPGKSLKFGISWRMIN